MSSTVAPELRELAKQIESLCQQAPCMSVAWEIIRPATNHLYLLARLYELNALLPDNDDPIL